MDLVLQELSPLHGRSAPVFLLPAELEQQVSSLELLLLLLLPLVLAEGQLQRLPLQPRSAARSYRPCREPRNRPATTARRVPAFPFESPEDSSRSRMCVWESCRSQDKKESCRSEVRTVTKKQPGPGTDGGTGTKGTRLAWLVGFRCTTRNLLRPLTRAMHCNRSPRCS